MLEEGGWGRGVEGGGRGVEGGGGGGREGGQWSGIETINETLIKLRQQSKWYSLLGS